METNPSTHKIESVRWRRIFNSHLELTNEFTIELDDGSIGVGASPQGETISVYEDEWTRADAKKILEEIHRERALDGRVTQSDFDRFLQARVKEFGRNNCWALSLSFFNATRSTLFKSRSGRPESSVREFPRLCLNVLNGGRHAYTNPVLSDFPEYLVVPKFDDVKKVARDHAEIQKAVRRKLASCERMVVNQNPVHRFKSVDNKECVAFLRDVLDNLGLSRSYALMIDASGGDLWTDRGYRFSVTDGSLRSSEDLQQYWMDLIDEFQVGFLEDPLGEYDYEGWKTLSSGQSKCKIIGDNFYSSDAERIESGSLNGYTHGAIIKPNQAGTISAVVKAIEVSHRLGQIAITSHRSISTESTFLAPLTVLGGVRYMKIGPLCTDYSSIMRFNELIRLTGVELD
jgi:enolase